MPSLLDTCEDESVKVTFATVPSTAISVRNVRQVDVTTSREPTAHLV